MDKRLRILHLEDQPDFSALVAALLEKEGLAADTSPVTDFASFTALLERESFDLILADYSLPTCNGMQALQAARQMRPEIPFLLVSGAIGEHAAVDILQAGAIDYVLKSGLERLVPAIRRAVNETRERQLLRQAESEARSRERQYHLIFNGSPVPMWVSELPSGAFVEVNEAAIRHYGFPREQFLAMTTKDICSPDEAARLAQYLADATGKHSEAGIGRPGLCQHRKKNGTPMEVDITWSIIQFHGRDALLTMANDVTELKPATEMLKKNEARLAAAQRIANIGNWELDLSDLENLDRNKLLCSEETLRILGLRPGKAPTANEFFFNPVHPEDLHRVKDVLKRTFRTKEPYEIEHRIMMPDGRQRLIRSRGEFVLDNRGKPVQMRGVVMDLSGTRPDVPAPAELAAAARPRPARPARPVKKPGRTKR